MGHPVEARKHAKHSYEAGETLKSLARRTGVDRKTLRSWRDREGWTPPVAPPPGQRETFDRVRSNVIDFATGKAIEHLEQSGALSAEIDQISEALAAHGRLALQMIVACTEMLERMMAGEISPTRRQNDAQVFLKIVEACAQAVRLSREIAGLLPGQPSIAQPAPPPPTVTVQRHTFGESPQAVRHREAA